MKNVLVISANGYGNVGDDICGYSGKYIIEEAFGIRNVTIRVVSPPVNDSDVDWADAVVIGGGGLLYDGDYNNVKNYMDPLEATIENGKKTAVLGVGVQGINTEKGKEHYRRVLNKVDIVTVRSPVDKKLLDEFVENVVCTQDIGFLTDEWVSGLSLRERFRIRSYRARGAKKPRLGLAPVDLVRIKGDAYDETSANFVDSLHNNLDEIAKKFDVLLLCHSADDIEYYRALVSQHPGVRLVNYKDISNISGMWEIYKTLDLVIASRFHAIILATLAGVPTVSVSSASTKQNRLANYDMDTLKRQRLLFTDLDKVKNLFGELYTQYTDDAFLPSTRDEVLLCKDRARQNVELVKKAFDWDCV